MLFLLLVCFIPFASAVIPDGFILDVSVDCSDGSSDATVTVKSDMAVKIVAHCATGSTNFEGEISGQVVSQNFAVKYGTATSGSCYFKTPDTNSGLSFIKLYLYYGRTISEVQNQQETYTVSCLSQPSSSSNSGTNTGFVRLSPEGIVQSASGQTFSGTISFVLQDVLGQTLDAKAIPIGKKVQLKATVSGLTPNAMTVSDCYAFGNDDSSITYQFLSAGCGDGSLFGKNEGFTTSGADVTSNYFPFFSLEGNTGVQFTCNFTTCSSACDVNSCIYATRRKRSVDSVDDQSLQRQLPSEDSKSRKSPESRSSPPVIKESRSPIFDIITVKSRPYYCLTTEDVQRASKARGLVVKMDENASFNMDTKYLTITVTILGTLTLVSTLLTLYMCFKNEQSSKAANIRCEYVKP